MSIIIPSSHFFLSQGIFYLAYRPEWGYIWHEFYHVLFDLYKILILLDLLRFFFTSQYYFIKLYKTLNSL